jgi:hypothetical protein
VIFGRTGAEVQVPNTRDAHGRYLKGTTGNPKGRPTKISMIEPADFQRFQGTMVEVDNVRGRKRILTREGAIQERLYASAMKGNVQAQIFLTRKFEQAKVADAESEAHLQKIYRVLQKEQRGPTDEEYVRLRYLRMALNLDPNPRWKIRTARPSRAKKTATPAGDRPVSPELESVWIVPPPPAKSAKPSK